MKYSVWPGSLIFFTFIFVSCASLPDYEGLPGMLYDGDGRPIASCEIYLEEKLITKSDINGRYFIPRSIFSPLEKTQVLLTFRKENFESLSLSLNSESQVDFGKIYYLRMYSQLQLLKQSWKFFEQKENEKAQSYFERARALDEETPLVLLTQLLKTVLTKNFHDEISSIILRTEALPPSFAEHPLTKLLIKKLSKGEL